MVKAFLILVSLAALFCVPFFLSMVPNPSDCYRRLRLYPANLAMFDAETVSSETLDSPNFKYSSIIISKLTADTNQLLNFKPAPPPSNHAPHSSNPTLPPVSPQPVFDTVPIPPFPAVGGSDLQKRLPVAIILGVKKGGTRALLEYLKLHPDIRAPGPEIHFFDRYFYRGIDWYRSQMPETLMSQQTLEKTPSYLITRGVPERIRMINPETKLLVVVRNPVTRALSDYSQKLSKQKSGHLQSFESLAFRPAAQQDYNVGKISQDESTTTSDNLDIISVDQHNSFDSDHLKNQKNTILLESTQHPVQPNAIYSNQSHPHSAPQSQSPSDPSLSNPSEHLSVNTTWRAIKLGLYHKHLARWLKIFPRSSLLVVSGERLISHPAEEVNLVEHFLGLKPLISDKHFYFNASKGFPCLKKSGGNEEPHCLGRTKGRTHPQVSEWALEKLRAFYEPHNQKLYELVGRDFGW